MPWPDEYDNLPLNVDEGVGSGGEKIAGTHWKASVVNPRVSAVNAIETELGLNPRGAHVTVRARLDAIEGSTGPHDINGEAHTGTPLTAAKGGTGNETFTDGEFLEYDGTAGKIQSAGCGPASFDAAGAAAAAVTAHEGAADPHAGYQKESEKGLASGYAALDAGGKVPTAQLPDSLATDAEVASAIATHEAAADPHAGYQRESEKGQASGYASLNASALVVENPANAQTTPAASRIPLADGSGRIAEGWMPVSAPIVLDREFNTSVDTTATAVLTHSVPANALGTTRGLRFTVCAKLLNNTGSDQSLAIRIKLGTTTLFEDSYATINTKTVYRPLRIEGTLFNLGANTDQGLTGMIVWANNSVNPSSGYGRMSNCIPGIFGGAAAEDTTGALTFEIALTKGHTDVELVVTHAVLELV